MKNKLIYIAVSLISGVILLCGCHCAKNVKSDVTTDCEDVVTTEAEDGIIFIYEDDSSSQVSSSSKTDISSETSNKESSSSSKTEESSSLKEDSEATSSNIEEFVGPIMATDRSEQPGEPIMNPTIITTTTVAEINESVPEIEEPNEEVEGEPLAYEDTTWDGPVLNPTAGVVYGPSGKETYYNLDMSGVVGIMRGMGYDSEEYPYWVDDNAVKHLGPYIMCAANLDVHPRGTLVESSLGTCIVCDTGGFAYGNPEQLDIAVDWP